MKRARQSGLLLAAALLLLAPYTRAQIEIGDETHLSMQGDASFSLNDISSDQVPDQLQYGFGGNATLDGYYHHPNFLSFRATPYYNQAHLNSDINSFFSSKGIATTASIFSGSKFPGDISFEKRYDTQGQFSLPGANGFTTGGNATSFSIGWGVSYKKLPPVHVSYGINDSSSDILGLDQKAVFNSHSLGVSSYYALAGFNLTGSYTNSTIDSEMPSFSDLNQSVTTATHQNTLQMGANRRLATWADFTASASRTDMTTDYAGANADQTFNTANGSIDLRPFKRLEIVNGVSYATSLAALLTTSVWQTNPNAPIPPVAFTQTDTDYVTYSSRAEYHVTDHIAAEGGAEYLDETFFATQLQSQRYHGGVSFTHSLLGGYFNAHYGLMQMDMQSQRTGSVSLPLERNTTVQTGSVGYSRRFQIKGWSNTATVQYFRNNETAFAAYTSTSYSGGVSASHALGGWNLNLNANVNSSSINGISNSDNFNSSTGGALSTRRLTFGGNYSHSTGNSLQTATGLVAAPVPAQILLPQLPVFYGGTSYAASGSYRPTRNLRIMGDYSHTLFETSGIVSLSNNAAQRYDGSVEYRFRQMRFTAGYSHISQGLGLTFNNPATVNAIYFGVSRHIDIF